MNFIRFDAWHTLEGVEVQVWRHGALVRTGIVDAVTADSEIAWTMGGPNDDRLLVEKARDFELRISLEQLVLRR
jgi:hypothetical protein